MSGAAPSSRAVLEERARVLARPSTTDGSKHALVVLTFTMAGETYGIEAQYTCGVFRLMDLAPLPGAPAPVAGLTAWRGDLLTVLDLRVILGLSPAALDDRAWIVAVGRQTPVFGLLAGAVRDVTTVAPESLRMPEGGAAGSRRFVRGVTPDAVLVLEVERLLEMRG